MIYSNALRVYDTQYDGRFLNRAFTVLFMSLIVTLQPTLRAHFWSTHTITFDLYDRSLSHTHNPYRSNINSATKVLFFVLSRKFSVHHVKTFSHFIQKSKCIGVYVHTIIAVATAAAVADYIHCVVSHLQWPTQNSQCNSMCLEQTKYIIDILCM